MDRWTSDELERASAQSAVAIAASRESCEDTKQHIDASRDKVAQSLELLRLSSTRLGERER